MIHMIIGLRCDAISDVNTIVMNRSFKIVGVINNSKFIIIQDGIFE
jgi:hypothetical protein